MSAPLSLPLSPCPACLRPAVPVCSSRYVKSELYERAIQFFQRAAEIQPNEVKWRLMVTSCYRRMQRYQKAYELYEDIHREYPENLECLRYLVAICKDLGMK